MNSIISLNKEWYFRLDPLCLGEHYPDQLNTTHLDDPRWMMDPFDDSDWDLIDVPSNWQNEGYAYNGVAWYRKHFTFQIEENNFVWLKFN